MNEPLPELPVRVGCVVGKAQPKAKPNGRQNDNICKEFHFLSSIFFKGFGGSGHGEGQQNGGGGDAEPERRKDVLLVDQPSTPWPGALEPGESGASPSRRKLVPPGVPDPAVLADPDATAADVALSATGARVRRIR